MSITDIYYKIYPYMLTIIFTMVAMGYEFPKFPLGIW